MPHGRKVQHGLETSHIVDGSQRTLLDNTHDEGFEIPENPGGHGLPQRHDALGRSEQARQGLVKVAEHRVPRGNPKSTGSESEGRAEMDVIVERKIERELLDGSGQLQKASP